MSAALVEKRYSPAEYLALERAAEYKNEYAERRIHPMTGANHADGFLPAWAFPNQEEPMSIFVTIVALFMTGVGLFGLFAPHRLPALIALWRSERGLWTAAVVRVAFGVALWLAAPGSRAPLALHILAGITVGAGVALPVLGLARFLAILDWWISQPLRVQRVWMAFPAGLGLFLLWAIGG